jgi:coenzyme Q-binding protein COQ10
LPKQHLVRRVPYSARAMYDLVADVGRYGEFVPGCRKATVRSRARDGKFEILEADMEIGHRLVSDTVGCRVRLDPAGLAIEVENAGGPLKRLANRWVFRDLDGGGSEVIFDIEFALKSRALGLVVGGLFDRVFLKMVDAFEARAGALYGAEG